MARPRRSIPDLKRHKGSGQGFVRLYDGPAAKPTTVYLGRWPDGEKTAPADVRRSSAWQRGSYRQVALPYCKVPDTSSPETRLLGLR